MAGVGSPPGKRQGGRKKGSLNKATAVLKEYAGKYCEEAVDFLVGVMRDESANIVARTNAARELLDRGHGRPAQAVEVTGANGAALTVQIVKFSDADDSAPK